MRLLEIEELKKFSLYRHYAPKPTYEQFLSDTLCTWIEEIIPHKLSANFVTLLGQVPLIIFTFWIIYNEGPGIGPDYLLKKETCLMAAGVIQWFSILDIVDGLRARKRKCGSPLGRIIDEGGDIIVLTCYSIFIGKALGFSRWVYELTML